MISAKVIEDSISDLGKRITTIQIKCHRFILSEINTHRVFSRNFSSSRAIPTSKLLEQIRSNPAMPIHWGKNQKGMQADTELDGGALSEAKALWVKSALLAADIAEQLAGSRIDTHKQIVNRVLEPFMWVEGIITSTEWDNFFLLRDHKDAQPEIQELARKIKEAMLNSTPKFLVWGKWHLPYISEKERNDPNLKREDLLKISSARCCRVSYLKHDGTIPNIEDDMNLFSKLVISKPAHSSPLEHQATPLLNRCERSRNFIGWRQFRDNWETIFNMTTE